MLFIVNVIEEKIVLLKDIVSEINTWDKAELEFIIYVVHGSVVPVEALVRIDSDSVVGVAFGVDSGETESEWGSGEGFVGPKSWIEVEDFVVVGLKSVIVVDFDVICWFDFGVEVVVAG